MIVLYTNDCPRCKILKCKLDDKQIQYEICDDLIIPQSDRILIFEDIDCMGDLVKDRNLKTNSDESEKLTKLNILKKSVLSDSKSTVSTIDSELFNLIDNNNTNNNLSYFLNILDGLQECPGRIIIMTTNKPEELDKALIRPGRIDYVINFTKASISDIVNTLQFYWETNEKILLNSTINQKYSHAEIINFCRTSETLKDTLIKINHFPEMAYNSKYNELEL
jgi:SpoVK/Ycf46/Vps4 family AAA+-type ATPase